MDPGILRAIQELWRKFLELEEDVDYYLHAQKQLLHLKLLAKFFFANFKILRMVLYEGTTDLNDHNNMFLA